MPVATPSVPSFVFLRGVSGNGAQSVAPCRETVQCWALANCTTFEAHNSMDLPREGVDDCTAMLPPEQNLGGSFGTTEAKISQR